MNIAEMMAPRRFAAPEQFGGGGALLESLHQPLYSMIAYDAAALPAEVTAFSYGIGGTVAGAGAGALAGATEINTNLEVSRALSNPRMHLVTAYRIVYPTITAPLTDVLDATNEDPVAAASNAIDDLQFILWNSTFRFHVGTKDYVKTPAVTVPGNFAAGGVAASAVASQAAATSENLTQGMGTTGQLFRLQHFPVLIPPQQTFFASMVARAPTNPTLLAARVLWIVLEGIHGRESQ